MVETYSHFSSFLFYTIGLGGFQTGRHNGLFFFCLGLAPPSVTIGSTLAYWLAHEAPGLSEPTQRSWWACSPEEPMWAGQTLDLESSRTGSWMNSFELQVNISSSGGGVLQMVPCDNSSFISWGTSTLYLVLSWPGLIRDSSSIIIPIILSSKGYHYCVLWNASCTAGHNKQSIIMFTVIRIFQVPFI